MKHKYGYGIVDRHGKPWWDESCVCKDREPLLHPVEDLNYDGTEDVVPYRVVRLFWESSKGRRK